MGNSLDREEQQSVNRLNDPQSWVLVQGATTRRKFRNIKTNQEVDEYIFAPNGQLNQKQQLEIYQRRKTNRRNLVAIKYLKKQQTSGICSQRFIFKVWVQHIKVRLNQVGYLTIPQAIFVLQESLIGFYQIYSTYGYVKISEKMIGLNCDGFIKVWMSESFQLNQPNNSERVQIESFNRTKNKHLAQAIMISDLTKIVESHLNQQKFPKVLVNQLQTIISFAEAINLIKQYIAEVGVKIPKKLITGNKNKINLVSNDQVKRKLSLKQQINEPMLGTIHKKSVPKNLNDIMTSPPHKQATMNPNNINNHIQYPIALSKRTNDRHLVQQRISLPMVNPYYKLSYQNPENRGQSSSFSIRGVEKMDTVKSRKNSRSFLIQEPQTHQKHQTYQEQTQKFSRNNNNKHIFHSYQQSYLQHHKIPYESREKLSNQQKTLLKQQSAKEWAFPYSDNKKINQKIQIQTQQGVIKGSGVIQNIRAATDRSFVETHFQNYSKPSQQSYYSPSKQHNDKVINNSYHKKYSYSSFFDEQLHLRSGSKGDKIQFYPNIIFDSEQKFKMAKNNKQEIFFRKQRLF